MRTGHLIHETWIVWISFSDLLMYMNFLRLGLSSPSIKLYLYRTEGSHDSLKTLSLPPDFLSSSSTRNNSQGQRLISTSCHLDYKPHAIGVDDTIHISPKSMEAQGFVDDVVRGITIASIQAPKTQKIAMKM